MLDKYLFNPGDTLPAENVDSIDPDNPNNSVFGRLIGDTDIVLQNFIDLGNGDNDGAFKTTIDGVIYDDVAIDLTKEVSNNKTLFSGSGTSSATNASNLIYQSFITKSTQLTISHISIYFSQMTLSRQLTLKVYSGTTFGSGDLLGSVTIQSDNWGSGFTFSTPISVSPSTGYYFELTISSNSFQAYFSTSQFTGGVSRYYDASFSTWRDAGDINCSITGKEYQTITSLNSVAEAVQVGIRAETGGQELCSYDTDHFVITSGTTGNDSEVLKFETPTTGTDISGAGYLDLGANATEEIGQGDEYKLFRLGEGGKQIQVKAITMNAPNGTVRIETGFLPRNIYIHCLPDTSGTYHSDGGWNEESGNQCIFAGFLGNGKSTTYAYNLQTSGGIYGTIENVNGGGFDIVGVNSGSAFLYIEVQ